MEFEINAFHPGNIGFGLTTSEDSENIIIGTFKKADVQGDKNGFLKRVSKRI